VEALTTGEDGVGSRRRNFFENGTSITEEVIEWNPNASQRIVGSEFGPIPLRSLVAQIDIIPENTEKTTLQWSLEFKVKYGPVGWLMGQLLMKRAFGTVVAGNLDAVADRIARNRSQT
ncbi:MAG: SRPBCC family protein, partial [Pseudomonadota bacterium]